MFLEFSYGFLSGVNHTLHAIHTVNIKLSKLVMCIDGESNSLYVSASDRAVKPAQKPTANGYIVHNIKAITICLFFMILFIP